MTPLCKHVACSLLFLMHLSLWGWQPGLPVCCFSGPGLVLSIHDNNTLPLQWIEMKLLPIHPSWDDTHPPFSFHSLSSSLFPTLSPSLSLSLTPSFPLSLPHPLSPSFPSSLSLSLTPSFPPSLPHPLSPSFSPSLSLFHLSLTFPHPPTRRSKRYEASRVRTQ